MNSDRRTSGLLVGLAAVAALAVAFLPRPGSSPETAKPDKEKTTSLLEASPPSDAVVEGPLAPIHRFLPVDKAPRKTDPAFDNSDWSLDRRFTFQAPGVKLLQLLQEKRTTGSEERFYDWPRVPELSDCRFRFLIATVPDPTDSGFAYMFDQVLESLQRAVERGDYVFDRAWLPWQRNLSDKAPDTRLRERHPGLILFRSTDPKHGKGGKHHLLALLLVGETPTGGIHKVAFQNAVRIVHECKADNKEEDAVSLRVIGPYFSGTAVSLRMSLEDVRTTWSTNNPPAREPWIKVVCGSASGFDHDGFVKPEWAGADHQHNKSFQTTIIPDTVVLECLRQYLGNPANPTAAAVPSSIGLLYESNTGFGQHIASPKNDSPHRNGSAPDFFMVPYPLHISQLRTAYTKEQLTRLEGQGVPQGVRNLPFPTEGGSREGQGHEAIQAQAPLMTTALNDLILNNLVTTIAQKRAKYVCLVSSDPQDTIFLARLIRDRYPDVQIATLGSNLLFAHEEYNSALRGMIVASTYPLYPTVQGWADMPKERKSKALRVLFADQGFEGNYNAALVQLADATGDPNLPDHLLDYGWEGKSKDATTNTYPPTDPCHPLLTGEIPRSG
jgi:hypothetical protein